MRTSMTHSALSHRSPNSLKAEQQVLFGSWTDPIRSKMDDSKFAQFCWLSLRVAVSAPSIFTRCLKKTGTGSKYRRRLWPHDSLPCHPQ